jgi:hypothetical protein
MAKRRRLLKLDKLMLEADEFILRGDAVVHEETYIRCTIPALGMCDVLRRSVRGQAHDRRKVHQHVLSASKNAHSHNPTRVRKAEQRLLVARMRLAAGQLGDRVCMDVVELFCSMVHASCEARAVSFMVPARRGHRDQ